MFVTKLSKTFWHVSKVSFEKSKKKLMVRLLKPNMEINFSHLFFNVIPILISCFIVLFKHDCLQILFLHLFQKNLEENTDILNKTTKINHPCFPNFISFLMIKIICMFFMLINKYGFGDVS